MIINPYAYSSETLGYGNLYNFYAASLAGLAPVDYKVAGVADYETLITFLSTNPAYQARITGSRYWANSSGLDTHGFKAMGAANRNLAGTYATFKESAIFWTDFESAAGFGSQFNMAYDNGAFNKSAFTDAKTGASVKMIYTGAGTPTTVTDNDSNVYDVVNINGQYWTVQNWRCTTLSQSPFTALTKVTDATAWGNLATEGYCSPDGDDNNVYDT